MLRLPLVLTISLLCVGFTNDADGKDSTQSKPNVLFLICDDLNCDLACYGHPLVQSPNIDKLARRGVRFENAHCQYPLCGPSRASFMAGLYPDQTLIHRNSVYLREHTPNVISMTQNFRRNGYFATRIGKIYHYGVPRHIGTSGHDDPYSWDYTINPRGRDKDEEHLITTNVPGSFGGTLSWLAADGTDEEQTDGIAATEAVELLKKYSQAQNKQPFFLAVGLYRPHTPYVSPKNYFEMYPQEDISVPTIPDGYRETIPAPAWKSLNRKKDQINMPEDLSKQVIQAYYASITFADAQLGKILDALDETGLTENTIVVFTSDHGYHMGEHGHWQKTTLYENATHVPLIIAGPGTTAKNQTTATPAEMVDFYPTLAELCGVPVPDFISGVSLAPALKDTKAMPRSSAFTQYESGYSIRTPRYRYTEWGTDGENGAELYDHQSDSEEMVNLAGQSESQAIQAKLSKQLRSRITDAKRPPKGIEQRHFHDQRRIPKGRLSFSK